MVEELLLQRGIVVSYETIRCWTMKFGRDYAGRLRQKAPNPNDVWHLDEVVVTIGGRHTGSGAPSIKTATFSTRSSRPPQHQGCQASAEQTDEEPGVSAKRIVTDKLGSYGAARRQFMPTGEHRSDKGLNNRAKNPHLPLRKRERVMQRFRSPGALQRFVSVFSAIQNLLVPASSKRSAIAIHLYRLAAMADWKVVTGAAA